MCIESQVGYFFPSPLRTSLGWLQAFVVAGGHPQSLVFSSLIVMCFLVWFCHGVCALFYLVCLDSCSFHQILENFQHFKKESLPGSFSVFYQDSSSKCARLSGIVAHVSEAVLDFLSVCFLWDRLCCSCLKVSPVLSFSLLWSAVNHLPWHFLVKYFSFLKVFCFHFKYLLSLYYSHASLKLLRHNSGILLPFFLAVWGLLCRLPLSLAGASRAAVCCGVEASLAERGSGRTGVSAGSVRSQRLSRTSSVAPPHVGSSQARGQTRALNWQEDSYPLRHQGSLTSLLKSIY